MRFIVIASFAFVVPALALGCTSATGDTNTNTSSVSGAVASTDVKTLSAVARYGSYFTATAGQSARGLRILISDKANDCSVTHFASSTMLDLRIRSESVVPGSYAIVNALTQTAVAGQAEADLNAVDGVCKDRVAETATGGTLTITTSVTNITGPGVSRIAGSLDATFPGGHLAGDFDAVVCDATPADPAASADAGVPAACTP